MNGCAGNAVNAAEVEVFLGRRETSETSMGKAPPSFVLNRPSSDSHVIAEKESVPHTEVNSSRRTVAGHGVPLPPRVSQRIVRRHTSPKRAAAGPASRGSSRERPSVAPSRISASRMSREPAPKQGHFLKPNVTVFSFP